MSGRSSLSGIGSIEKAGKKNTWRIRVSLGKDPVTGKYRKSPSRTVHGTKSEAAKALMEYRAELMDPSAINPEVVGSNPAPATKISRPVVYRLACFFYIRLSFPDLSIKTLSSRNFATNAKKSRKRSWRLEVAVNHQDFYTTNSRGSQLQSYLQCAIVNDLKFPVFSSVNDK